MKVVDLDRYSIRQILTERMVERNISIADLCRDTRINTSRSTLMRYFQTHEANSISDVKLRELMQVLGLGIHLNDGGSGSGQR